MVLSRRSFSLAAAVIGSGMSGLPGRVIAAPVDKPLAGKSLSVGIHNRVPWGYIDSNGKVAGFHPDVVRAALTPFGVKEFNFLVADFGALIPGLMAGRFDIVASGVAITPARCAQVIFGEPDLAGGDGLLVLQGNPLNLHSYADIIANPKARLGGGRGTTNLQNAIAAGVPVDRTLAFPNAEAVISALLAGRIDAATMSATSAAGFMHTQHIAGIARAMPFTGLLRPDGKPALGYTAVLFRKDETSLRDLYNTGLARLKADGTLREIRTRYGFTDAEDPGAMTTQQVCDGKS
jgi:polar amino acid transport system substrate-binding protein